VICKRIYHWFICTKPGNVIPPNELQSVIYSSVMSSGLTIAIGSPQAWDIVEAKGVLGWECQTAGGRGSASQVKNKVWHRLFPAGINPKWLGSVQFGKATAWSIGAKLCCSKQVVILVIRTKNFPKSPLSAELRGTKCQRKRGTSAKPDFSHSKSTKL